MARGDGWIFPRGKRLWFGLYVPTFKDGKVRRVAKAYPTGIEIDPTIPWRQQTTAVNKATKMLRKKHHEVNGPSFTGAENEKATVAELLDDYAAHCEVAGVLSMTTLRAGMNHLKAGVGVIQASLYGQSHSDKWILSMREKEYSEGSIVRWHGILMSAFHHAKRNKRILTVPEIKIEYPDNEREGHIEPGLAPKMLDDIKSEVRRDFAKMFYLLGVRPIDIRNMYWNPPDPKPRHSYSVVYRDEGVIRIPPGIRSKNKKPRVIPIVGERDEIIERRWAKRAEGGVISEFVFHVNGNRINLGTLRHDWDQIRQKYGRPDLVLYQMRHAFTRDAEDAGVSKKTTMQLQGHTRQRTSDRYNTRDLDDEARALQAVDEYRRKKQGEGPKVISLEHGTISRTAYTK